jgi:hypothetical protein
LNVRQKMKPTGLLVIVGVVLAVASIPAFIGWRLRAHKRHLLSTIFFLFAFAILALPASQLFILGPMNDRYIDRQKAKAEKGAIVGQGYDYVLEVLGTPNAIRHERPATIVSQEKTIRVVGEPYTALEYRTHMYLLGSPNFLVILDAAGKVSNFRYND